MWLLGQDIMELEFEIKQRDLAGRICKLNTCHGAIETPTILPVISPHKQTIPAKDMRKFGADAVITNAYILWKDFSDDVLDVGLHNFLDFHGPIMTDSGAFQLMNYGDVEVTNREIIKFQEKIGADIGVILDIPTIGSDYQVTKKNVIETIKRAKASQKLTKASPLLWCGPLQGGEFKDLLRKSAAEMRKLNFQIHALGSVAPKLMSYDYASVAKMIIASKESISSYRPLHLFGAGHPMFFAFAVALGVDLFDSASYALYAEEGRYMTRTGTKRIDEMAYLPCCCPVCSKHTADELRKKVNKTKLLAEHNLYLIFEELREIKEAIRERTLWELLESKARTHPALLECMNMIVQNADFFKDCDPVTKSHFFYLSDFSKTRTELSRVKDRIKRIKSDSASLLPFGKIPKTVMECYPFAQTVYPGVIHKLPHVKNSFEKLHDVSMYWLGTNIFDENMKIDCSAKTHKIRSVFQWDNLIATFRASDFYLMLHDGAKTLHKKTKFPLHRVVVADGIKSFIKKDGSVFARHVSACDKSILPGQQVLVVDKQDTLLAAGEACLNSKEMREFEHGTAVKVRWVAE